MVLPRCHSDWMAWLHMAAVVLRCVYDTIVGVCHQRVFVMVQRVAWCFHDPTVIG